MSGAAGPQLPLDESKSRVWTQIISLSTRKHAPMEAAAIPKTHAGTSQHSPERIQLQQQDLIPPMELPSKEGHGGQDNSRFSKAFRGLPVDPSGLHKQQLLCLLPSDAIEQGESEAQGTPSAQPRAGRAPTASQFLRPVPPADKAHEHTDSPLP